MRQGWTIVGVLALLAGCASSPPPRAERADTHKARPFIERSAIDVPRSIPGATLVNIVREENVGLGVDAIYRIDGWQDASLDLFVFPAGNLPPDVGVRRAQEDFIASLHAARQADTFSALAIDAQQPFELDPATPITRDAHKTLISMSKGDTPLASRAWVTYRQNYFFKVRLSAPAADAARIDLIGDAIARVLLRDTRVTSIGRCGQPSISMVKELPPGQPGMLDPVSVDGRHIVLPFPPESDALARAVVTSSGRLREHGCVADALPPVADGLQRLELPFKPEDWTAAPPR